MKITCILLMLAFAVALTCCQRSSAPTKERSVVKKDSIAYHITYRDTVVYRYDTIRITHYVHSDTAWLPAPAAQVVPTTKKKKVINPSNFGIGPSIGAYYSPFNGFDVNIGFGVQYYFLSIPSIRKPHLSHKHRR